MTRKARLHFSGALYHVSLHTNAGQSLFTDKQDGQQFCQLLAEGQEKFDHCVLGYCLLDDQVHLAIQVADQPLAKIMHNLTFRYTRYFNTRHQRTGHLFAGRYRATVVQAEKYLPDLIRYLHLSPVRLNLATKAEDYLWSSHRAYLGKAEQTWVATTILLQQFDVEIKKAQQGYQDFIYEGMAHGRPKDLIATSFTGQVFGDEAFVTSVLLQAEQKISHISVTLQQLIRLICREYALTESELVSLGKQRRSSKARGVLAYLVKQIPAISFTDLAKYVNRDATTLSGHATRVEKKLKTDQQLEQLVMKLLSEITYQV
jgi:REP element-mobilizing transposase RayT